MLATSALILIVLTILGFLPIPQEEG
jgi:hypothetical protein